MNKTFKILETIWLIMGIIGTIMSIYTIITGDSTGTIYFIVFTFVSGLMYYVRKKQRKRYEANQNNK
jgi:uncharacterized membrane-anchored protein